MSISWESNVRKVIPYTPGEQPKNTDVIKLNTNENPYPPSPRVKSILNEYDCGRMRLYPDPDSTVLVEAIADRYGLETSQVFVGVGSDDVLSVAFLTFFNSDKPILFPDITYSFYDVWTDVYKIPYKQIPLTDDFRIDPQDYKSENGGIIFPNPNAPTGCGESLDMIEEIVKANPDSVVIIDEAYIDFGAESALSLIDKYENLLVIQTFSKSRSMAGMRIGFAMGNKKLIKYMNDVKFSINSYTMTPLTQLCGAEAVRDEEYFQETVNKIVTTRENSKTELAKLGFTFTDSKSNFIFASHASVPAEKIFNELKKRGIYVRYWNKPRISNHLRISVGTDKEMEALVSALKEIIYG
ncbi:MAG: histidinol-phosphate transaminase [Ruminococcus flavefaciens]|nr:histidinol-phosphate transaminase [Ruminococcus flavefaciens]MCM1361728.1 histidinol-phosphate transaminase [Clostridiales bacterium]MCM1436077.1 histidinol-phosphate transaminase [Ruminococcus flavefaciens]